VARQIVALLGEVQAETGVAIVFITHDLRLAAAVSDTIIVMDNGRIVEAGDTAAVLAAPQSEMGRALVAAMPGLRAAPGG
jgi:peptide/nickel transport system ATP-binding protein